MQRRYFFWFTVAFLAGIGLAAGKWSLVSLLIGVGTLTLISVLALVFLKDAFRKLCILTAAGLVLGFLCFTGQYASFCHKTEPLANDIVTVSGRVEEVKEGERLRLLVRGTLEGFDLYYPSAAVYVYPDFSASFAYGDMVTVTGEAYPPLSPRNFGESDYRYISMGKGVYASLYPKYTEMKKTGHAVSLLRPADAAHTLRTFVQGKLHGRTSERAEGFLRALLTGDKSLLGAEEEAQLRGAGLSHIVAVSGLHLQMVVGACMAFLGILRIKRRTFSVILYLLVAWFFVLFTGASASVLRAALMLTVFFLADFFRRDRDSLTALSAAAFFLCLANPALLWDISFQLSCLSTLSILLFFGPLYKAFSLFPRPMRTGLSVSLAAFIGAAPVGAYHFGTLTLTGILANLAVCPLLSPLMLLGFSAVTFSAVPLLSDLLFFLSDILVRLVLGVAAFFSAAPFSSLFVGRPTVIFLICYFFSATGLYLFMGKKVRTAFLCICLCLIILTGEAIAGLYPAATLTFLDVGNGSSTVVCTENKAFLFDGGGNPYVDTAARTVLPYLQREGIQKVEAAFLTGYQTDHAAGLLPLVEGGYIGTLFLPHYADYTLKPALAAAARRTGTPVRYLGDGDVVTIGALRVSAFDAGAGRAENLSLLYRLDINGARILVTGDIDENGLRRLVSRGADMDCDILLLPQHGAAAGALPAFTDATSPSLAVLSCAEDSPLYPSRKTLSYYAEKGIPLYRTDQNGSIRIRLSPRGRPRVRTRLP